MHKPCLFLLQDVVLPFFSSPARYLSSPLFGAPPRNRTILGFFRGRIQFDNPAYSQGTRQFLANASGGFGELRPGPKHHPVCFTFGGVRKQHLI